MVSLNPPLAGFDEARWPCAMFANEYRLGSPTDIIKVMEYSVRQIDRDSDYRITPHARSF
jgi:hypothetical protein